ncbi:MAG: hypothetical protein ACTSYB_19285 [Candidatus Helarchaeota archaeon]
MVLIGSILQDWNANLQDKDQLFTIIAKEISTSLRRVLVSKVYIAIVDALGTIHYITPEFDEYLYFIQSFIKKSFHLLEVGDHSIPFGGVALAFFKISSKALVILYMPKGPSGQLLAFKPMMNTWAKKIDELIGDISTQTESTSTQQNTKNIPEKPIKMRFENVKRVPLLVKPLPEHKKFPLDTVTVLQYCDGTYSIEEICEETKFPRLKVELIIREYQKKKFLKIMRLI